MNHLQLAWRNLLRNPRRTGTTLAALVVGLASLLLFSGFTSAIMATLETGIVTSTGHLHVQRQGFARFGFGNPTQYSIENTDEVVAALRADPAIAAQVRVITPLLLFNGLASRQGAGDGRMVGGEGVDVAGQQALRQWDGHGLAQAVGSRFALPAEPADAALVGVGLARMLGLCAALGIDGCAPSNAGVPAAAASAAALPADLLSLSVAEARGPDAPAGGRIDLLTASAGGAPNVIAATVVSAQNQGLGALDSSYIALQLEPARRLVFGRAAAQQSTMLVVQLHETRAMAPTKAAIQALLQQRGWPLVAVDFHQFFAEYRQIELMFRAIFGFVAVLMAVIVLFTVANTMSAAVIERTAEIGTVRALGLRPAGVQRLFLLEGALVGVGGTLLGVLLALGLAWLVNHAGLTWVPPNRVTAVPLLVHLGGDLRAVGLAAATLLAVTALSAWLPARRGARQPIVEALRHA
jgi:putative ABC transport system permease protein